MSSLPNPAPDAPVAPLSQHGRRVSEEEYWSDWYDLGDLSYEWNDGRLEERPVSDFETFQVYAWLTDLLGHFLRVRPMGKTVALEMGFRLALASGIVVRKPDLGVVLDSNPVPLAPLDSSYRGVFDLCIEALSTEKPAYIRQDLVVKKAEYAAGGVREYYVLHREPQNLAFYGLGPGGIYAPLPVRGTGEGRTVRSRVLPGFRFRILDLMRRPGLDDLRRDPFYSAFVLPEWSGAERAREQAEQARERAEQARERAERERDEARAARCRESAAREAAEAELARLRAALDERGEASRDDKSGGPA